MHRYNDNELLVFRMNIRLLFIVGSPWRTNMKKFIPILLSFIVTLAGVEQITAQGTIPTQTAIIKTRSYAAGGPDVGRLIVMNCSTACTLTLPNPVPSPNWTIWISSIGAGLVQISPNGLQMNGSSSNLILNAASFFQVAADKINYFSTLPTQSSHAALKPQSPVQVQYASANGNDSNDGLSLGTAKRTVYAALLALPGGNESTLTAGYGTVWLVGDVNYGGPVKGGGFWIMGHLDPNFSSPPRGWLKSSGPISLRAYSPSNAAAQNHMPNSYITAGAGAPDLTKPAMWISGLAANYWIRTSVGGIMWRVTTFAWEFARRLSSFQTEIEVVPVVCSKSLSTIRLEILAMAQLERARVSTSGATPFGFGFAIALSGAVHKI